MLERLKAIDTAAVDELETIKEQRTVLSDRLAAMEERQGSVSPGVYARVRADYEARHAALGEQARPHREQALGEYAKLRSLLEELGVELDEARFAREEVEFRHSLGEFDGEELDRRVSEAAQAITRCEASLAEANEVHARFVGAFESEDELLKAAGSNAPRDEGLAKAEEEAAEASFELADEGETPQAPPGGEQQVEAAEAGAEASKRSSPITAPITAPRMEVRGEEDGRTAEFPLQPGTTTIGRSPRNDICVREASVSRHHAKIVFTQRGVVVYDLGSENGVFVNGERVKERLLAEGDEVEFGPGLKPYVFRGPSN
jgi:hypothetical protein